MKDVCIFGDGRHIIVKSESSKHLTFFILWFVDSIVSYTKMTDMIRSVPNMADPDIFFPSSPKTRIGKRRAKCFYKLNWVSWMTFLLFLISSSLSCFHICILQLMPIVIRKKNQWFFFLVYSCNGSYTIVLAIIIGQIIYFVVIIIYIKILYLFSSLP